MLPFSSIVSLVASASEAALPFAQAEGGPGLLSFLPLVAMAAGAYFLFVLPQQNKQKDFQSMLDGLKENDHIVTTGGIHGVITSVQRDQGRLTIRVDESNGTKMRIALWAVDSVQDQN